jgi:hypothetical protein
MLALSRLPLAPATAYADGSEAVSVLDGDQRGLLLAISTRMVETGRPDAPSPSDVAAIPRIERLLGSLGADRVDGVKLALRLVDLWPVLFELRFRRFRNLTPEQQDESLDGWRRSGLELRRRVFYALRAVAIYGYWSADATWPLIGYGGPWIRRA